MEIEKEIVENSLIVQEQKNDLPTVQLKSEEKTLSMWNDVQTFEATQRMAVLLAKSEIVPQAYRGKVADCVIAIDIGNRMGISPIAVMQGSQIVQGNFSWKGVSCKAMIDSCGKYKNTRYVEVGEKGKDSWGFYLEGITKNGEVVKGVAVTIEMAKKEGWYDKPKSKWQTMPELMLKYRCAAFFMRTECSGLSMGFLTAEENEDIYGDKNEENKLTTLLNDID